MSSGEAYARRVVRERSAGRCELCGARRAASWSHRLARGQGGLWRVENGLDACGDGTTGCHGTVESARPGSTLRGWRVPRWADPARAPALLGPTPNYPRWWYFLEEDGGLVMADPLDVCAWQDEVAMAYAAKGIDLSARRVPAEPPFC